MKIEEAEKIIEEKETNFNIKNRVLEGLQIISKYVDNMNHQIQPAHDVIFACSFSETVEKMTLDDVKRMAELGWHESEDSWAIFT